MEMNTRNVMVKSKLIETKRRRRFMIWRHCIGAAVEVRLYHTPVPREPGMQKIIYFMIFTLVCTPSFLCAQAPDRQALFKIERNKNANIVQYDVQIGADGKLLKKEPVVGYWIRLADKGQVQELSWVQKTFAYGFSAKYDRGTDSVKLDMKADINRPITVRRDGDRYLAKIRIEGSDSWLDKIFIHATGKGMSTNVDYIELYGDDVKTGDKRYEKIVP
jgi:hypothetical protein